MLNSMWKWIVIFFLVVSVGLFGFIFYNVNKDLNDAGVDTGVTLSPFNDLKDKMAGEDGDPNAYEGQDDYPLGKPINIMLLGIDRRARSEAYRTDIMILVSVNPETNSVVMSSIPRDLWHGGGRINATFLNSGWEEFQRAVEKFTGQRPERFILTDFADFSWLIDAMGGVPVEVDTTFTDSSYPVDATKGYQTISFTQGPELLTGERALIYSRSRKGNNGEGSDWARMVRQHKILRGMLPAVLSPKSLFNPMVVEEAFKTVTTGKMDTNMEVSDAKYLWDFYKDKDSYTINSLYLDYDYLHSPPLEEYGGAWVLVSKTGSYKGFHNQISTYLRGEVPQTDQTSDDLENVDVGTTQP